MKPLVGPRWTTAEWQISEELKQFLKDSVAELPALQVNGNAFVWYVWIYLIETDFEFLILNYLPRALTSTQI